MIKVWIGRRESDIETYNIFDYSITFYGSNINTNYSFAITKRIHSNYSKEFIKFVINKMNLLISKHAEIEFHFYNNSFAHRILNICPELKIYISNLNSSYSIDLIRHKTESRLWMSNIVNTPSFASLSKKECCIKNLIDIFGTFESYVIQKNYSGGGDGTYIINKDNEKIIIDQLDNHFLYLVSPYYYPNESYSCILFVDKTDIVVFAFAQQILSLKNNHISYRGNKFIDDEIVIAKLKNESKKIAENLQYIEYYGICGLDFIIYKNEVMLIEANPRFLGSTYYINYILKNNNFPSLFEINTLCFNNKLSSIDINNLEKLYSDYCHYYISYESPKDIQLINELLNKKEIILFKDGVLDTNNYQNDVYLCRYIKLSN